ncbi:MAG: hypothetical protein IJY23_08540 [Clostridia bacterium]|nr:hypothetical protein [Clostridia bacterium]
MATFYNQATLIFDGSSTTSNITEGQITAGAGIEKIVINGDYTRGESVSYLITLSNTGSTQSNVTLSDNLGRFTPTGMTAEVTPLEYIEDSLIFLINGIAAEAPTAAVTDAGLVISDIEIPAGSTASVIYSARANEYASLTSGSTITNTVTISAGAFNEESSASATVTVRDWTSLTIAKAICPEIISESGEVNYTFIIQNTGNTPAVATDNVIITDTFTPILNNLTVTLNGEELVMGTGYTYDATSGEFATLEGAITVPAATFTTNTETGVVSVSPGVTVLTVSGTV